MRIFNLLLVSACFISLAYGWCEPGQYQCEKTFYGCEQYDCLCLPGFRSTFPISQVCEPICGDHWVVGEEECDGGLGCCGCKCREGYVPNSPATQDCVPIETPVPVCPPITPPVAEPVTVPVTAPVTPPVTAPVSEPVTVPVSPPPLPVPVTAPVTVPVTVPVSPPTTCTYRTQTQGGWGAGCTGNNPACYRDANFDDCFEDGVTIGRTACNYATFTSAAAVEAFLPSGGPSVALTGDFTDPTGTEVTGTLAGQLLAALLNVGFDRCRADFSQCTGNTGDLCFIANPCAGFTVDQTILAAQYIIGACSTTACTDAGLPSDLCSLSFSEINTCLTDFNEAFDNGNDVVSENGKVGACPIIVETSRNTNAASDAVLTTASAMLVAYLGLVALL